MPTDSPIDDKALDSLAVAPAERSATDERQQAGQDESIARRMAENPHDEEAGLDNALDETMDASDPVAVTQPGHAGEPPASSGFDADAEAKRARDA